MDKTPATILNEMLQKKNIRPEYELLSSEGFGTHNPMFRFQVKTNIVTGYGEARSKKDARQEAAKDALAKLTEYENPIVPNMSKTPVAILHELMQKKNIVPQYDLLPSDGIGTHNPLFRFRVTADNVTGIGEARSKKDAKHDAAKSALNKLTSLGLYIPQQPTKSSAETSDSPVETENFQLNYVGMLKTLASENNLPSPEFQEISDIGPAHQRIFTIQCVVGSLKKTASELTKKKAKQICAQRMYQGLLSSIPKVTTPSSEITDMNKQIEELSKRLVLHKIKPKKNYKSNVKIYSHTLLDIMKEKNIAYDDLWKDIIIENEETLTKVLDRLGLNYTLSFLPLNSQNKFLPAKVIGSIYINSNPSFRVTRIVMNQTEGLKIIKEAFEFLKTMTK